MGVAKLFEGPAGDHPSWSFGPWSQGGGGRRCFSLSLRIGVSVGGPIRLLADVGGAGLMQIDHAQNPAGGTIAVAGVGYSTEARPRPMTLLPPSSLLRPVEAACQQREQHPGETKMGQSPVSTCSPAGHRGALEGTGRISGAAVANSREERRCFCRRNRTCCFWVCGRDRWITLPARVAPVFGTLHPSS